MVAVIRLAASVLHRLRLVAGVLELIDAIGLDQGAADARPPLARPKCEGKQVAVSDVDLTLRAGECVGLVGHNGAGKSTMIKMMLGLLRPSEGTVRVLGDDPAASASARDRGQLGYLPENVALYPSMTGPETLAFYARLKGQPVSLNTALLEKVGIAGAADRRVGTYSKGMRQRLGLAQALLGDPRVLLLDEPTTGLDPALRQQKGAS